MLMRLWSLTFPCTDFRHPVMTPMLLLMCEYLMRCQIESARDLAVGCFLCSMLLSVSPYWVLAIERINDTFI
jgi:nucleolar protein 14